MTRPLSRRRFLQRSAGFGAALGLALVGCTSDEGETPTPTSTPGDRVRVRVPAGGTRPVVERSDLALGALTSEVGEDALDPVSRTLTYSRLVGFDPRTASVYGDIADAVELPEPLTVAFRLREGLRFHPDAAGNVEALTAEAVARDFEARRDEGVFLFTDVVDQIETPSDTELVLRLRAPFSLLFEHLARADASVRGTGTYGWNIGARLGAGPFLPVSRDGDDLVMSPNPVLPPKEQPRVSQLRIRRADAPSDLDAMFLRGLIAVREHPDERSREVARERTGRTEQSRPRQRMRGLALSLLAPRDQASREVMEAFRDDRVRRAASLAINRAALGAVDGAVLSGPVVPAFAGDALPPVELEAHPLYQHDVGEARALLTAAGYEGLDIRVSYADGPLMLTLGQRLLDQMARANIRVRLVGRPGAEFESAFLGGDFEAAFFELDRLESPDLGLRLHTSGGLDGERSPWGYSNPVYDASVREALSQVDPAERTRLSREAQRLLLDDVPAMFPLTSPLEYASLAPGVTGYEFDAYGFNAGVLARFWQSPVTEAEGRDGF